MCESMTLKDEERKGIGGTYIDKKLRITERPRRDSRRLRGMLERWTVMYRCYGPASTLSTAPRLLPSGRCVWN